MVKPDVFEQALEDVFRKLQQGQQENSFQAQSQTQRRIQKMSLILMILALEQASPARSRCLWACFLHLIPIPTMSMKRRKMMKLRVFSFSDCVFLQELSLLRGTSWKSMTKGNFRT